MPALLFFGSFAAILATIVVTWAMAGALSKGPRILFRSIITSFLVAPGAIAINHAGVPVPFGILFHPKEAFASEHMISAALTWVVMAALLLMYENRPKPCRKCGTALKAGSATALCPHCESGIR
jgi:hypothetical protein